HRAIAAALEELVRRLVDHHADALGLSVELGDDDAGQHAADRDAHAAHDEGQGPGDHERREDAPLRRAKAVRDIDELPLHRSHAFDRRDHDREDAAQEYDHDLNLDAEPGGEHD